MSALPNLPDQLVTYASSPASGIDVGRQFDEYFRFFGELLRFLAESFRSDGLLPNGSVGSEQLRPGTALALAGDVVAGMNSLLHDIRVEAARARAAEENVRALRDEIAATLAASQALAAGVSQASEVVARRVERLSNLPEAPSLTAGTPLQAPEGTLATGALGPGAGGFYGVDDFGAAATAQDWAQVSIEWAEHMPDTIPPNILAISAITGQHWSSRWWAQQAAAAVGGALYYLYMPPSPTPPTSTPNGGLIPVGAVYYNTSNGVTYIWTGTAWTPIWTPSKAVTSSLYYAATAGQTAFPLTASDMFGGAHTLASDGSEGVEVFLNGARLTPTIGAVTNDYTVTVASSTVTLAEGATVGAVLCVDILASPAKLAPVSANLVKIKPFTPDGTTTTFPLLDSGSTQHFASTASQLWVSLDGSPQNPGVDFTISSDQKNIIFTVAPAADAAVFVTMAT